MQLLLQTAEDLVRYGKALGACLQPGQCITMDGDLGAGKTTMTQGIAQGLSVKEWVTSPTFTIVQQYDTGRLPLYHMDVYRIRQIEELYDIGFEEFVYGDGVTVIEWAELILAALPEEYLEIRLEVEPEGRKLTTIAHGASYESLLEEWNNNASLGN